MALDRAGWWSSKLVPCIAVTVVVCRVTVLRVMVLRVVPAWLLVGAKPPKLVVVFTWDVMKWHAYLETQVVQWMVYYCVSHACVRCAVPGCGSPLSRWWRRRRSAPFCEHPDAHHHRRLAACCVTHCWTSPGAREMMMVKVMAMVEVEVGLLQLLLLLPRRHLLEWGC